MSVPPSRLMLDDWSDVPIGLSPDGTMIFSYTQLPSQLVPSRVVIGPIFFEIDGLTPDYSGICKGTLIWLVNRL